MPREAVGPQSLEIHTPSLDMALGNLLALALLCAGDPFHGESVMIQLMLQAGLSCYPAQSPVWLALGYLW